MTTTRAQDAAAGVDTRAAQLEKGDAGDAPPSKKARATPSLVSDAASPAKEEKNGGAAKAEAEPTAGIKAEGEKAEEKKGVEAEAEQTADAKPEAEAPTKPAQTPAPTLAAARARARRAAIPCEIVEEGTLAFLVTPRVRTAAVASAADAQRLYIALLPDDDDAAARLLVIGRKSLPTDAAGTHGAPSSRAWGFVDAVSRDKRVPALFEKDGAADPTKKKATKQPAVSPRVLAEGHYLLCRHGEGDAVLAYEVDEPGDVSDAPAAEFGIGESGAFHVTVKNPGLAPAKSAAGRPLGLSGKQRATVDDFGGQAVVDEAFGGRDGRRAPPGGYAWTPATALGGGRLLQVKHAELLLVGTSLASSSLSADAVAALRAAHHEAVGEEAADEKWVRDVLGDEEGALEVGLAVAGEYEEKE